MPTLTALAPHFLALDAFLTRYQSLWRPRPFMQLALDWEVQHPELATWLRAQPLAQAEQSAESLIALAAPDPFPRLAHEAAALTDVATYSGAHKVLAGEPPKTLPGRKWEQIVALSACIRFSKPTRHWLDWCAGKGHLGRHLAQNGVPLTCLEQDTQLDEAGQRLSAQAGILAAHQQQDVLAEQAAVWLTPETTPVALHACGDLHRRLIELAIQKCCPQLAIVPCCYNRMAETHYRPLSQTAQTSTALTLSQEDLRLPLAETVTAGQRIRRQRDHSMAWRLGFDLVQRQVRQHDQYLPTPSVAPHWLSKSFKQYCQDLGALRQVAIPQDMDWRRFEQAGWKRLAEVRNLEQVRALFRRPLELWLVLDAALLLAEQGYHVYLGAFCAPKTTPRNLLILAERV